MDEDIAIIDSNTRKEKFKNFFIQNRKIFISIIILFIISVVIYFTFGEFKKKKKIEISDLYNSTIIEYSKQNQKKTVSNLVNIIYEKDTTYSPLSLYFLIDEDLLLDKSEMNELFEVVINDTPLEKEIKNLIIYKKGLFYADEIDENGLLGILNPLINSDSVWNSHALYLLAEYFYSKNEKEKSKEFFIKIIKLENANQDLKIEAQKRLSRDLSE
tara:strand:- start:778 stop:1422 length:645 start_codon:yes stop_codon:yes gene_type:complete